MHPEAATASTATILVVDDEAGVLETYRHYLAPAPRPRQVASHRVARRSPTTNQSLPIRLLSASSGERAIEIIHEERAAGRRIQAAFFDMKMSGGIDGLETMRQILAIDPDLMCVVVTAYTDQPLHEISALFSPTRQDDWDYLNKPFNRNEVVQKARNAISSWWRRRREEAQAAELQQTNVGLEEQVAERTQNLRDAYAELERHHQAMSHVLADLETANERLRVEMAERGRLEAERRLTSKLESIGQLAAGIAHEINTPTQYILSNAELLDDVVRKLLPEVNAVASTTADCAIDPAMRARAASLVADLPGLGDELEEAIGSVMSGTKSIARIVSAMREFARVDAPEMRLADLNRAITATLEVVRHEYHHVAEIEVSLGKLPSVKCHVGEIQQVLVNVIVNACHAIQERADGKLGRITIRSQHDPRRDCVEISVRDNGVGIAPEHVDRVFDPFFTTKAVGYGTGQGLTIGRNVLTRHRGTLSFESELGVGTEFVMTLPVRSAAEPVS